MSGCLRIAALMAAALVVTACTGGEESPGALPGPSRSTDGATSWIVSVGDSYISGEGARWAANTNGAPGPVDALGPRAYADRGRRESAPGCHRAKASELQISDTSRAKTLACSGATTSSSGSGATFKPGLDFYDDGAGHLGQAAALEEFASSHQVSDVVVSIGGNDFGFGEVVARCAGSFFSTVGKARPSPCRSDPDVRARFTGEQARLVENRIVEALRDIAKAMNRAGYDLDGYGIVVQTYPSPIPPGPELRYRETLLERGLVGGCPFFSTDATWANTHALATINEAVLGAATTVGLDNLRTLDLTDAFVGHRLCEKGVGLFDPRRAKSWRADGFADSVEWVNRIYTGARPWQVQESLHPNYWGVLAARTQLADLLGR